MRILVVDFDDSILELAKDLMKHHPCGTLVLKSSCYSGINAMRDGRFTKVFLGEVSQEWEYRLIYDGLKELAKENLPDVIILTMENKQKVLELREKITRVPCFAVSVAEKEFEKAFVGR